MRIIYLLTIPKKNSSVKFMFIYFLDVRAFREMIVLSPLLDYLID